jgi:integrase
MAKRRPSGDGMVRKRDDGRWEGRIVVGHKENGDSIFRYVYADTQKALTAKLRQSIDAYQGADLTEDSRMTLGEWMDRWLENVAGTIRPSTLKRYQGAVNNHFKPNLGDKIISQITAKDIRKLYDSLARHGNQTTGEGLSSSTIRDIHGQLHAIMKAAVDAHLIIRNPTEDVPTPKFSCKPKQILTDEQLDKFMDTIQQDAVWHDFFYTELTTGLRRGEICGLQWQDFDEASGTLSVRRTVHTEKGGELTTGETKTGQGTRKILLPSSTAELLRERKRSALTEWIFPDPLKPEQPTSPRTAYNRMKVLLKQAGLPSIRFHDLRHTFATHALTAGVDVKTLSGILGHTRAAFTLDTYTHTTGDMQKRAAEIVEEFLTDIFGKELKPWEESAKMAKERSA